MANWYTSDTHFGHFNIVRYQKRPFLQAGETYVSPVDPKQPGYGRATVDAMNEQMIARWNQRVQPNDTVFHTGDFAFLSVNKADAILQRLNGEIVLVGGNHDSEEIRSLSKWHKVCDYLEIAEDGHKIVLSHFAFLVWNKGHRGALHFHGHSHGSISTATATAAFLRRTSAATSAWTAGITDRSA